MRLSRYLKTAELERRLETKPCTQVVDLTIGRKYRHLYLALSKLSQSPERVL